MFKAFFRPAPFATPHPSLAVDLASLALRAALAVIFIYHGLDKIQGEGGAWGTNWLARLIHVSPGAAAWSGENTPLFAAMQAVVAWGEVVGGCALGLGLLTRLAACGMVPIQLAAISLAYSFRALSPIRGGGSEYNMALIAMCVALVFLGSGRVSFDWAMRSQRKAATEAKPAPELAATGLAAPPGPCSGVE